MANFQTKNPNLGKFWKDLQWKVLVYFMAIWSILCPFRVFCCYLVYFILNWDIFPGLVCCAKKHLATLVATQFAPKVLFFNFAVTANLPF
jgi:hypothetical protein